MRTEDPGRIFAKQNWKELRRITLIIKTKKMEAAARPALPSNVEELLIKYGYNYDPVDGYLQFTNYQNGLSVTFSLRRMLVRKFHVATFGHGKSLWIPFYSVEVKTNWTNINWSLMQWKAQFYCAGLINSLEQPVYNESAAML